MTTTRVQNVRGDSSGDFRGLVQRTIADLNPVWHLTESSRCGRFNNVSLKGGMSASWVGLPDADGAPGSFQSICESASDGAVVVQHACWRPCVAGNGTEILVDGLKIIVSHVLKIWPWHDLQERAVERERDAARV